MIDSRQGGSTMGEVVETQSHDRPQGDDFMNRTFPSLAVLLLLAGAAGAADPATPAEEPAASKLLADARAARANWVSFPGFTAELEVNFDGKVARGTLDVSPGGK